MPDPTEVRQEATQNKAEGAAGQGEAPQGGAAPPPNHDARFAAIEAENKTLRDETKKAREESTQARNTVGSLLDQLKAVAARSQAQPVNGGGRDMRDQFDEDPVKAVDELFAARMNPIVTDYLNNTAIQNREQAKDRLKDKWGEYEQEIDEFMANMPLDVKARPGSYESAYRYVLAGHLDEEIEKRTKAKEERSSQSEGASAPAPRKADKQTLDPLEKSLAKEFGLSEDEWIKYKHTEEKPV